MTKKLTVIVFILVLLVSTSVFADNAVIPKDIKITVIEQNTKLTIKRSLVIMLNKKVTKEVLRTIALKLKQSDPSSYERTFIGYYINDLGIEYGFWARTDFTPNLDVRIIGLTLDKEKALATKTPIDPTRTIVGTWLNEGVGIECRITIFYLNNNLYLERKFSDGSSGIDEMIEKDLQQGRKLVKKRENRFGEYYLINNKGEFQYWDKDGHYYTAKTLEYHLAPKDSEQQQYAEKRTDELTEMKFYLQKLESFRIELMAIETLQQFNEDIRGWNIRLDSTSTKFDVLFGKDRGEYKGYCDQAYWFIGIGLGTLESQTWLFKKGFLEGRYNKAKMIQSNMEVKEYIGKGRDSLQACIDDINWDVSRDVKKDKTSSSKNSSGKYKIGEIVELRNPSGDIVAIHKYASLQNIQIYYTNGTRAKIIEVEDGAYRVRVLKSVGWVSKKVVSK